MRKNRVIMRMRKVAAILAIISTTATSIAAGGLFHTTKAKAASVEDFVDLRMVFTTDLHGMLSSMDYLSGVDFKNGGLSRAYNLIELTRNEKEEANVFTFDVGDVLFEASMEYIMGQDEEAIQPIYRGMAMVGYDAITLGNHDFDYGKEYILRQLKGSGLLDKVVVSNLTNTKDGSYPFHKNMLIERQAVTQSGEKVDLVVGVIGETIPTLSAKTDNYAGIWKTEDIVENVKKEAALLKEQGADVIVVLAHSGFGDEMPELNADNVVYALTMVEEVDVILSGHEHNEFPTSPSTGKYYDYLGVDPITGLVNDKVVVMARSNGRSIGVADLTLSFDQENEFKIEKKSGEVRRISDYKVKENPAILANFAEWSEELEEYRTKELIQLSDGVALQNYLGLLGDSAVLQLQNNARIAYARKYIETVEKAYSGYPVIAAASHISYGANSLDDYVDISGSISYANLFTVQNYRNYTYIYKITGAQLKEWLELSASAYNTLDPSMKHSEFLIQEDWMEDWSQFYVFDGINYKINPYVAPRYDIKGKRISSSKRVSNITYNGKEITDDMEFILACNTITPTGIFSWAKDNKIKGMYRTQNIIADYFASLSKFGKFTPTADHNWSISFLDKQEFLMILPNAASKAAESSNLYKNTEFVMKDKTLFRFQAKKEETKEPYIIALQSNLDPTMKAYDVFVDAYSSSGVKSIKYHRGEIDRNDVVWNYAAEVKNHKFTAFLNDVYTIFVEDNNGKKATYQVITDNIGVKEMAPPKVWSHSNRKTTVTGRAEAGATVYVELKDKTYKGKANSDGSYVITIPSQISGTTFYVYQEDIANERKSDKTRVYVKYNGPNKVTVDKYYNNSQYLTGKTNQKDGFLVVIDENTRQVYLKQGGKDVLLASTEVDYSTFDIEEVNVQLDEEGNFRIPLPNIEIGSSLRVFNMDSLSTIGPSSYLTVLEGGPYGPTIHMTDAESTIYGKVESVTDLKGLNVVVTVNGETYETIADKNGNFKIYLSHPLVSGTSIAAYAIDEKNGKLRNSKTTYTTTKSIVEVERSDELFIGPVEYNSKSIKLNYLPNRELALYIPYVDEPMVTKFKTNANGSYKVNLTKELKEGALVKVTYRNNLGTLVEANYSLIAYRKPSVPVLSSKLTNSMKYLKAVTKEDVALYADMNGVTYESLHGSYKEELGGYEHILRFDRVNSGTEVWLYAKNVTTLSERLLVTVDKVAPDIPKVEPVLSGTNQIIGSLEIFLVNSEKKATLKNTKTKVFARINKKNYTGVVLEDGSFTIKVPKLKAGTEIDVFAYNRYGYGPIGKIIAKDMEAIITN